jgi:hypothetical protein
MGLLSKIILLCCILFPTAAFAEVIKGIYGVPSIHQRDPLSYVGEMEQAGVNAVFVKPDRDTVTWFKERGFKVFISMDAFGGRRAWKKYPDSRPVLDDGSLLGTDPGFACHGGACPTHSAWRMERLGDIERLLQEFGGSEGRIDGIWLDYIRYPGRWSVPEPKIPDTCYCKRCLRQFSRHTGITLLSSADTKEKAFWIKKNYPYEWMQWKQEQIASFVSDVGKVIDRCSVGTRPLLGIFLVPWTRGERFNAVSYQFAQDPFQLAAHVDVISPMLYHKKVGRPASWTGFMTQYYEETVPCRVWPIVQAMDCTAGEFGEIMRYAGEGGADGVLGYPFSAMKPDQWVGFREFHRLPNLLGSKDYADDGDEKDMVVEIRPEYGQCAEWVEPLPSCDPVVEYAFRGEFWQAVWENGRYPEVSLWGERFLLNTHWKSKIFQPLRVVIRCPESPKDDSFRFINCNPQKSIRLRRPELKRFYRFGAVPEVPLKKTFFDVHSFPIGVYGANLQNLWEIKKLAVNTVVLRGRGKQLREQVEKCHEVGLRYVLSVPHEPDLLPVYLDEIGKYVRPYDLAFYVNDEPGIHSFPTGKALDVNRLIKGWFPDCATCMAIVRPQVCGEYKDGADFFMLDQYPVPFMPMTWLSDCMNECGEHVGRNRLASVIQAFGGKSRRDHPRPPTWQEMDCLAFLSVVHGSRGVFFYTFSWIGKTEEGRERLGRVVGRLNRVYPWLLVENSGKRVQVEMLSRNRFDPEGRPAVQCCLKRKDNQLMVIAVNTIGTGVEVLLGAEDTVHDAERNWKVREVFSGENYVVKDGKIRVRLGAYGVKAFVFRKVQRAERRASGK